MADLKLNNVEAVSESSNVITIGGSTSTKVLVANNNNLETQGKGRLVSNGSFLKHPFHKSWVLGG